MNSVVCAVETMEEVGFGTQTAIMPFIWSDEGLGSNDLTRGSKTRPNMNTNVAFLFVNFTKGVRLNLTANFRGFNTTLYRNRDCMSTVCLGVEEVKELMVSDRPL